MLCKVLLRAKYVPRTIWCKPRDHLRNNLHFGCTISGLVASMIYSLRRNLLVVRAIKQHVHVASMPNTVYVTTLLCMPVVSLPRAITCVSGVTALTLQASPAEIRTVLCTQLLGYWNISTVF